MFRKIILGFVCVCVCPFFASASELTAKIQQQYTSLQSFQAHFVQKLTNAATHEVEVRSGMIAFAKPRNIRWETVSPEKELLLVGSDVVWDYFPGEEVAYKYAVEQVLQSKTMLRFISGEANLEEDFVIEDQGEDGGQHKVKLIPKEPESNLVLAYLWVHPDSHMLGKILIVDFFGNGNELELSDMILNGSIAPATFIFSPPQGVDVQDSSTP
ncbi:MAG: outer membrane lipoprotein carrier protein LolA [Desulfoplanes sp.]|nr:outer membrane lipoprotein carrier protein LolA [Desulfoplanes sp.]